MADAAKNKDDGQAEADKEDAGSVGGLSDGGGGRTIVNAHLVYKSQAISFLKNGQYQRAAQAFTLALEESPQDKETLVMRSQCHLLLGDLKAARRDVEVALEQDAKYVSALYWKAEVLFHQSEFEDALIFFHRGRKMRPDEHRFRLGAQKTEQAMLACLEQSGMELEAKGKLDIFYNCIPDGRPKTKPTSSSPTLSDDLSASALLLKEQQAAQQHELLRGTADGPNISAEHKGAAQATAPTTNDVHVRHHVIVNNNNAVDTSRQVSRQRERDANNRRKQNDKLRACVLGDLNKDRKLIEKILDGGGYMLPINETFRPHNEEIEHECKSILDFLDQRQQFWLQRNPQLITQNIKRADNNVDNTEDDMYEQQQNQQATAKTTQPQTVKAQPPNVVVVVVGGTPSSTRGNVSSAKEDNNADR